MAGIDRLVRRAFDAARGGARVGGEVVGGALGRLRRGRAKSEMDDTTLARKVETELFRGPDAPKSSVNVNVANGVVELRGQVKHPEDVKAMEARVRKVPEVHEVENFLHLPKTPSPTRTDTPARQRKTERSTKRTASSTRPRTGRTKTTAEPEREARGGEPSPDELAARREGRPPAPMGTQEDTGGEGSDTPEATPPADRSAGPSSAEDRGSGGAG